MTRFRSLLFFGILFLSLSTATFAQIKIPALWNMRVHDDAKVLSQQTIDYLEKRLKVFEDSTSNQMAIVIIPSLEGEEIENFGIRLTKVEEWKLGTKGKDNGVVIVLAIKEHKIRIEVGQGLEGALPDAICNRIIRNEMAPSFRRDDYDGGIIAATNAVIAATKGEYKGEGTRGGRSGKGRFPVWLIVFVIIGIISMFSKRNGGGRTGGWSSGGGFFMGGMGGGGGSWGGGGGGGGFSGGGGSFGGGGSSGSW